MPATVIGLGLVSLLTDLSSDAIFPLLPAFLAALGAAHVWVGVVEGVADLVASLLKYFVGLVADRRPTLKPLVLFGYGVSTVARPLVALAAAPWHVLAVRIADRVGKGVRSSPRDALIAGATDAAIRGRAFGFHRAMDHAGAALGTMLASGLLWLLGTGTSGVTLHTMRQVFVVAAVPGVLAMLALVLTPEPRRAAPKRDATGVEAAPLPPALRRGLLAVILFAIANATDAFLLVKAMELGASPALTPMLWLLLHLVKAATGTRGGRLSDRVGKKRALMLGWSVYALTWGAVGLVGSLPVLFGVTAIYGTSHGLVEGAEKALVAELAGGRRLGKAFGAYNLAVGVAALVSSTTFGWVWDHLGGRVAFVGSALFAVLAVVALAVLVPAPVKPANAAELRPTAAEYP
ncbi:MAG: MFS transporter [Deltaproteobacteria bacterium]|nr:MFS transporter [Deltaproteobacteria bacterium]